MKLKGLHEKVVPDESNTWGIAVIRQHQAWGDYGACWWWSRLTKMPAVGNPHSLAIQSLCIHTPQPPSHHTIPTLRIQNSSALFRSHTLSFWLYANPDYVSCTPDPSSYSPLLVCAHPNSSMSTRTIMLLSFSIILLMAHECGRYLDTSHRYLNHIVLLRLSLFVPI